MIFKRFYWICFGFIKSIFLNKKLAKDKKKIKENPKSQKWLTYLPVEIETNTLVGSCGYKGAPNEGGVVEIGYEIAKEYRNRGFATEVVQLLIQQAFKEQEVCSIIAHTLANKNASVKVLKKNNFHFVKELEDDEDGKIWKWELVKIKNHAHQVVNT